MPARRQIIWLPEAAADLDRLRDFLIPRNPSAAARVARQILQGVNLLEKYPEAGRPVEDPPGFRDLFIPFGSRGYVLRYRLNQDKNIAIVRVWHASEDRASRQ